MTQETALGHTPDEPAYGLIPAVERPHSSAFVRAKTAVEVAVTAIQVTPANEALRGLPLVAAGLTHHTDPLLTGAILGASTLLIEGSAALATADLLSTGRSQKAIDWIHGKTKRFVPKSGSMPPAVEAGVAYLLGTSVVLAERQREDPSRTYEQNKRHGLFTAAWLSGTLAVQGTLVAEGIHTPSPLTIGAAVLGAAAIPVGAKFTKDRFFTPSTELRERHHKIDYELSTDSDKLDKAAVIEQTVWDEKAYGDLAEEGYDTYIEHSRTFTGFKDGECIGMSRLFQGSETVLQPFLTLPFDDESERQALIEASIEGKIEEMGTAAVVPEFRGKGVNLRLWRMAYRDAISRGVENLSIVMEPDRVQRMNENIGMTFKKMGGVVKYQGGECASHVMNLAEVDQSMRRSHPIKHYWFTKAALRS